MYHKLFILLMISLLYFEGICQTIRDNNEYYKKVKQFYHCLDNKAVTIKDGKELFNNYLLEVEEYLFFDECYKKKSKKVCDEEFDNRIAAPDKYNSLFFKKLFKMSDIFDQGESDSIFKIIDRSKFYDEQNPSWIALDLKFSNGKTISFCLNKYSDEPVYITNLYLPNGESIFNYFVDGEKNYLERVGIITDKDGFVNVRERPENNSKIISKIYEDELFHFTPNCDSKWWKIKSFDGEKIGYIYFDKIAPFGNLSQIKKNELMGKLKNQ